MPRVKGMPMTAYVCFEPGAKIHGIRRRGNANVAKIPRDIAGWDIHAAAQSNSQMHEITADANPLAKGLQSGAISPRLLVVKSEMAMNKIANGLYSGPSRSRGSKPFPSEVS
jgi:hypothetical protein